MAGPERPRCRALSLNEPGRGSSTDTSRCSRWWLKRTHYLLHRSTTAIEPSLYLQDLFTAKAARGRGIGKALIEGVYAAAREAGCARVYWQTHETNHTAMRLYDQVAEKSGFIVYRKLL
jgi:GNAT superfamily N-acetyltransferase